MQIGGGRYAVRRVLGQGGQKTVYLVHDGALDRECALAVVQTEALAPADVERLQREAQVLAKMGGHPHIVTIFDIGREEGRPFIVSEYVTGGDLSTELERAQGPLELGRALTIGAQLLDALAAVHDAGIVHRDLKPSNVWLDGRGRAKLGDFGLAIRSDHSRITQSGTVTGTPAYVSPEQLQNQAIDGRADLYSLGCVLYELLTGRTPFMGTVVALITQHLHAVPAPPSAHNNEVSPALDRFVLKLLAKSPDQRFSSAREALAELPAAQRGVTGADAEHDAGPTIADALPSTQPSGPVAGAPDALGGPGVDASRISGSDAGRGSSPAGVPRRTTPLSIAALAALVAVGVAVFALSARSPPFETKASADRPASASANPEAVRLSALGDRLWRTHSLVQATDAWTRAVELDPELPHALLHLALESVARQADTLTARRRYRAAAVASARLVPRERALLEASAPMFEPVADPAAWHAALERTSAAHPSDAEILYWKAHAELMMGQAVIARRTAQAAMAADPEFLQPYTLEWSIAADLGEDHEPLLRRCAQRFPRSGSCAGALVWLAMRGSDCDALDALARGYASEVPDHFIGDRGRALAFHARGAPSAAVAELLQRAARLMSAETRESYGTLTAELAIADGDLISAEVERRADLERSARAADAGSRAMAVARLADLLHEEGRAKEARALVRDFLEREAALEDPITGTSFQRLDGRADLLEVAARTGALPTRELAVREQRLLGQKPPRAQAFETQLLLARTASAAAAAATSPIGAHEAGSTLYLRGRALALAGRPSDAIRALRSALGRCDRLTWALDVPRARLLLAQLLEESGERAGAVAEYRAVAEAWGRARPRSITSERAQERLRALRD
ncbi:MAG: serine/threonine protein kinase [Deltaproteobacteria bacterium]|nr:serine/threonine protein kinase [Deltaproteobacteria bacterium]